MTAVATLAGAASGEPLGWHSIDWQSAHRNVRRLQARIVKAVRDGRWGKVKALQHLLTHSFSGKALAVKRVTENQGKRTPGVDGVLWNTPEKKAAAVGSLRQRGYRALPLRRVYIPKSGNPSKKRALGIPCVKDRAMQALYLLALDPIAETRADPNSYGFRSERSTADAIDRCFVVLAQKTAPQWILEGDIRACFDGISHSWMVANIPMDTAILRKWLTAGFIDNRILYPTHAGTPQGGIASPVLMNLALDGLERTIREHFPRTTQRGQKAKVHLSRYADDFIITGSSKELLEDEVKPLVEAFLKERGLDLSQEKTRITHIEDGFDFLGQNVRKYHGTLLITPSRKNVKAFLGKIRETVKAHAGVSAGSLIAYLNPLIRGWANYHRHVVSKEVFVAVDHAIFKSLWQWAKRRHPHKRRRWIRAKYFKTIGGRHWVFSGQRRTRQGETQDVRLASAADVPIRRHVKIRGEANPYDPAWETYFEERLGVRMAGTLRGRRKLLYLWRQQRGLCPICNQKITKLTGWHSHHIVWRSLGGKDGTENRLLLHPNCHRQVHSKGIEVAKPCSSQSI